MAPLLPFFPDAPAAAATGAGAGAGAGTEADEADPAEGVDVPEAGVDAGLAAAAAAAAAKEMGFLDSIWGLIPVRQW